MEHPVPSSRRNARSAEHALVAAGRRSARAAAIVAVVIVARLERDRALADLRDEPRPGPGARPPGPPRRVARGRRGRDDGVHAVASGGWRAAWPCCRAGRRRAGPVDAPAAARGAVASPSRRWPRVRVRRATVRRGRRRRRGVGHAREDETLGRRAGQVLRAVHRDVRDALEHRALDLDGEDAFATDHRERRRRWRGRPASRPGPVARRRRRPPDAVARARPGSAPAATGASPAAARS